MNRATRLRRLACGALMACAACTATAQQQTKSAIWWNPAESGWGLFTIDQGNVIAPGWYTFDSDGEPVWFLAPSTRQADGSWAGDLLRVTGVPFAHIAGQAADPAQVIGRASFRFDGEKALTFSYTANGQSQNKQLTRFAFGNDDLVCRTSTGSRAAATNYSDLWWNASQSGWGLHLSHVGNSLFATWYTFDADREPIYYTAATTRQADGSFTGTLSRTRNGTPFDQINGSAPSSGSDAVGSATLRFSDGENGTFSYTVGSVTQSKPIARTVFGSSTNTCAIEPYQATTNPGNASGTECVPPYRIGDTRRVRSTSTSNGATETTEFTETIVREAMFQGQNALVQEVSGTTSAGTGVYGRSYLQNGNNTQISFGAEALNPSTGQVISTSVNDPLRIEQTRFFTVDQPVQQSWKVRSTAQGFSGTIDLTNRWKLVGRESVTTPAGSFDACKFEIAIEQSADIAGVSTRTSLTGTSWTSPLHGVLRQQTSGTSTVTGFGQNLTTQIGGTLELLSATSNGQRVP